MPRRPATRSSAAPSPASAGHGATPTTSAAGSDPDPLPGPGTRVSIPVRRRATYARADDASGGAVAGILRVVATPIGNLEDLSTRAARVLREAGLVLAEDTRRTGRLLAHVGASTPQRSLHEHNEA